MYVFVHNEKTAGTSFKFILRNNFGAKHCDANLSKKTPFRNEDLNFARKSFFPLKSIAGHNLREASNLLEGGDLQFITFLRDPIMRCISNYQDNCLRHGNKLPLEEWINNEVKQNVQVRRIAGIPNGDEAIRLIKEKYFFVGLTERFSDSLKLLQAVTPENLNLRYKKLIIAKNNEIKKEILADPEKMELIRKHNEEDIKLYRFISDEFFPEMFSKYEESVSRVSLPEKLYKSRSAFKFRCSTYYNKLVYKILLKIFNKRA